MNNIGSEVKKLRQERSMTLKELSALTNISTGFLSQFERDQNTIAIDSLQAIADVFNVSITHFLGKSEENLSPIVRSYSQKDLKILNSLYISKILVNDASQAHFLPRLVEILPSKEFNDDATKQTHMGVEFIYILEGVLDLLIDNNQYTMYPGDAAYFESSKEHNWINNTTRTVKLLSINSPNTFKED